VKRIKLFMVIFFICLCIPLGYFILRTHQSLDQEERSELRYFADTLFYEIEKELADLVLKEEGRAIEEYTEASKLSVLPDQNYILGYFQNNPDGSFQTPMAIGLLSESDVKNEEAEGEEIDLVVSQLKDVNQIFNTRRSDVTEPYDISPPEKILPQKILMEKEEETSLASRYLDFSRSKKKKDYLGQEKSV